MGLIQETDLVSSETKTQSSVVQKEPPKISPAIRYEILGWTEIQLSCFITAAVESGHTVATNISSIWLSGPGNKLQFFSRMSELLNNNDH